MSLHRGTIPSGIWCITAPEERVKKNHFISAVEARQLCLPPESGSRASPSAFGWKTGPDWKGLPVRGGFLGQRSVAFAAELHFTLGPVSKPRRCVLAVDDIELLLL